MWLAFESIDSIGVGYANSLGRALVLAQSFEHNCKYVLLIANLGIEVEKGIVAGISGIACYSERLESWFRLGRDIQQFKDRHEVNATEIEILRKGVVARNYIAHEAAYPMMIGLKSSGEIANELPNFIRQVSALAEAENLIAQWSFMIQEKTSPPSDITANFPSQVTDWVIAALE